MIFKLICRFKLLIDADHHLSEVSICTKTNSLPNNKISDYSKFKAFADDKVIVTQKLKLGLERVENIVGKGENAGYQHFLLSTMFSKAFLSRGVKSRDCVVKG